MTIKDLRQTKQITQVQAAKQLGVSERSYQRWENGETVIPTGRLMPFARLYGVSVTKILLAWAEMYALGAEEVRA